MTETLLLVLAGPAGAVIGALFFGGLWWTIREGVTSTRPALLFWGSLLVRSAFALGGFYLVGRGHWQRLLLSLLGFVVARGAVMWSTRAEDWGMTARQAAGTRPHEDGARRRPAASMEYTDAGEEEVRRAAQPR